MADTEFSKPKVGFGFGDEAEKAAAPVEGGDEKKAAASGDDGPKRRKGKLRHRPSKRTKANAAKASREPVDAACPCGAWAHHRPKPRPSSRRRPQQERQPSRPHRRSR
ncbi:MAG: hypothetical protein AAFY46_01005, partial [Planctomycetota bacterium]